MPTIPHPKVRVNSQFINHSRNKSMKKTNVLKGELRLSLVGKFSLL